MKSTILKMAIATLALTISMSLALAHTAATTSPKTGAVLSQSPPAIEIKFGHEASLTSVVVIQVGKPERKLDFAPKGSAKAFTISNANLGVGRNEVQWKALSKDGHVMSGSIVITIEPVAPKAN
jgi:copper resistance protein C